MKTHILANIIIGGILASSAAQAESAFSTRDLDVVYSGFNPSFTRNLDVSNYYRTSAKLQAIAANTNESTCHWHAVKNDSNLLKVANPVASNVISNYLAPRNMQLVC